METELEKITFVLVAHNSMPHIQATINSLVESTRYPFKLIIVESESVDGTKEYVDYLSRISNDISVIHTKKEGTIRAFNIGIRNAEKDNHIFLCHDDTYFFKWYAKDWLHEFMNLLKNDSSVGIIMPLSGGGTSGPEYIDKFVWAGTWSTLIRKEAIEKLGKEMLFDENFGKGYGDDIDLSYRIVKEGFNILSTWFWIDHHRLTEHHNNDDILVEDVKKKNSEYFRKKHKLGEFA